MSAICKEAVPELVARAEAPQDLPMVFSKVSTRGPSKYFPEAMTSLMELMICGSRVRRRRSVPSIRIKSVMVVIP